MINGFSTLGAVALRMIEENQKRPIRHSTKYTLDQAIEKVCFRKETIYAEGSGWSYLWWWFCIDQGETSVEWDQGKLRTIPYEKSSYRYIAVVEDFEQDRLYQDYKVEGYFADVADAMLRMGMSFGQKALSRTRTEWSSDYWGESDSSTDTELLYVEPWDSTIFMIPLELGQGMIVPKFKGFTMVNPHGS